VPRVARIKSNSGIYHIIMRGINRQTLFEDEEDCKMFIQTMQRYKEMCEYMIYAYCLMDNHLHLLLKEGKEPLETVMRRICGSYVFWYNRKYGRVGYLFQDRYKSEPVEDKEYFLTVIRYIFHNPIKAGIVTNIQNYKWTNYIDYIDGIYQTEIDFVLNIFDTDRENAKRRFIDCINKDYDDKCMDIQDKQRLTDDEARKLIKTQYKIDHTIDIQKFDIVKRNSYLKDLKGRYGLSIRQIERLTGISRGVIQRI
jgi:REP element-mobilizing transposase RayT